MRVKNIKLYSAYMIAYLGDICRPMLMNPWHAGAHLVDKSGIVTILVCIGWNWIGDRIGGEPDSEEIINFFFIELEMEIIFL